MLRNMLTGTFSCVFVFGLLTNVVQAQVLIDENFEGFSPSDNNLPLSTITGFVDVGTSTADIRTGFGAGPNSICVGANCILSSGGVSEPMKAAYNVTGATSFAEARLAMAFNGNLYNSRNQLALLPDGTTVIPTSTSGTWADVNPDQGTGGPSGLGAPNSAVIELAGDTRDVSFYTFDASGNLIGSLTSSTAIANGDFMDVRLTPASGGVRGEFRYTGNSGAGPIQAYSPIGGGTGILAVAPGFSPATYGVGTQTAGAIDNMFFLVPEPTSATLLGIGLVMMLMNRRRRSR